MIQIYEEDECGRKLLTMGPWRLQEWEDGDWLLERDEWMGAMRLGGLDDVQHLVGVLHKVTKE